MLYVAEDNNNLNDVRRAFSIQAKLIMNQLNEWQQDQCPELIAECAWDVPGYFSSEKKVHAMPDSSILVRENEPTSIIAYTLNCASYKAEIQQKAETKSNKTLVDDSSILSVSIGGAITDEDQDLFIDETNENEVDNDDFYFSSLERYYFFDNEDNISYNISSGSNNNHHNTINKTGSSAALHVVTTAYQEQQASPSFASARQTLVQGVRQQRHNTHPHIEKLRTRWHTRFSHYHHPSGIPSQWKRLDGEIPAPLLLNNNDFPSGKIPINWDIQEERTISQQLDNSNHKILKEIRLHNIVYNNNNKNKKLSPHIRHRFVHSNIEFTCIVYYGPEFEDLRKRCGIEQITVESLCRCQPWQTSGGKSKSRFYKTKDDRFVVKEMISSWNSAEKQQFLKSAPAYFDYMKRTTSEIPSILTKILGFYTIRITDYEKRATWAMDVMVMDHLFYNRSITQRFDFKGIRDRQVLEKQQQYQQRQLTTLWDGDWLHGYRLEISTTQYSKALTIDTALKNDAEFIEKCNFMDYSLLVGIDEQNKEIVVGVVDFIGAYTWYKKIESKSKSTLKSQKRVTVLPPQQYRARFCQEISNYFVSVPGKFIGHNSYMWGREVY
ncbi:hypothetical protein BDC45DRAFT_499443 [Circinella umbellata]|nr:hypothetical protein BDC45DRAFT_499443 [Circinella umbellata]